MQNVYRDLGKISRGDEFLVTSGSSASLVENTEVSLRPRPYDDNYGYGYAAFVVRDAAGASAAPEGEYSVVSAYDSSIQKWTVSPVFSAALAIGDTVALANDDIPLRTMIELANRMLK